MNLSLLLTILSFCYFLNVIALVQTNEFNSTENRMSRPKRFVKARTHNQCAITIRHREQYQGGFCMNFKTEQDNNWKNEFLDDL